jgi:fatty acid desaturase
MSTAVTATGEKPLTSAALRELSARSNLPGAVRAVSHYGAIGVFGALIWLVSSSYGVGWALPLIAVQGYFVAFLFMVVHETAHKTAFRSRALNLALGHLSSFAIGLPYEYYCLFHWDHHRYTQDPDPGVRADIADVLGFSADAAARPIVASLIKDQDKQVALAAERAALRLRGADPDVNR